ncbi:hypothetical protein UNPA324_28060 [Bradyrhizobium sp. UNPA324]|nr:hypothetical protein UNPA324_28060 [Bradyrhizobium sp. UNPA324]
MREQAATLRTVMIDEHERVPSIGEFEKTDFGGPRRTSEAEYERGLVAQDERFRCAECEANL